MGKPSNKRPEQHDEVGAAEQAHKISREELPSTSKIDKVSEIKKKVLKTLCPLTAR